MSASNGRPVRPPFKGETIRVGVVGTGFGALVHVPALAAVPDVEVVALCGIEPDRLRQAAREHDIPHIFDDFVEMLDSGEVDAVTLAVPPDLHHAMAVAACEAGVHVLSEKPLATNAAEARDLEHLVRDSGICHGVAFHRRYEPARKRMKELVAQGFIGDLHSVSVIVYRSTLRAGKRRSDSWTSNQERGGGVLSTIASHYVDQLRWWFGDIHAATGLTYTAVHAPSTSGYGDAPAVDADDNASFVVRFATGAIGSISISYTAATDVGEEIVVSGADGMLAIQEPDQIVGARPGDSVRSVMKRDTPRLPPGQRIIEPFRQLATDWARSIRTGAAFTPSFEDGARVQEVLDAVTQSQRLRRWVDLSGENGRSDPALGRSTVAERSKRRNEL
ncbi:MAG: Gfo/Idh/MocA family oxidoreductase [Thermomicrobiales bacterium]